MGWKVASKAAGASLSELDTHRTLTLNLSRSPRCKSRIYKSLFGYDRSVPFPHTNDRFLPFRKVENGTAVWHNMK